MSTGFLGATIPVLSGSASDSPNSNGVGGDISPREVLVLSVTKEGVDPNEDIVEQMIRRMELTSSYKPDILCLPESFATSAQTAEAVPGPMIDRFSAYAAQHNCYLICPLHRRKSSEIYNTAVMIDRKGTVVGMYDKIHPTEIERERGIMAGKESPAVFETDFGKVGILICFDINWVDEWRKLKEGGAEIVFWTAAYPGGRMLSSLAWMFQYYVVGCSRRAPALVYDMSGDLIATSGIYEPWTLARLNMEKILCEVDYHVEKIKVIREKYGRKVHIKYYHDEDWVTVESRSPDLKIQKIVDEFGLVNHWDYIKRCS